MYGQEKINANFNSTLVWLKDKNWSNIEFVEEFQFYISLIKRNLSLQILRYYFHFNSTLVWLKASLYRKTICIFPNFNSTLVWLKESFTVIASGANVFQFYISLIKSAGVYGLTNNHADFNSTLVWLKDSITHQGYSTQVFQFYISLIKRFFKWHNLHFWLNFNSTLVWLKAMFCILWCLVCYISILH